MLTMEHILRRAYPVLPVLVIDDVERAVGLAQALCAGGLSVIEVTLRTPQALEALRVIRAEVPRSEEHTSELQSRPHLVCRLLLEKKKKMVIALPFSIWYFSIKFLFHFSSIFCAIRPQDMSRTIINHSSSSCSTTIILLFLLLTLS